MPPFIAPTIYEHQPNICLAMANRSYIQTLKKQILDGVLWSKESTILLRIGSCDLERKKVDSELTQEALGKLKKEVGQLGISLTVITGELDITDLRYPVYLLATNNAHQTEIPNGLSR